MGYEAAASPVWRQLQGNVALGLMALSRGGALHGAGVEHGRGERTPIQIMGEHLAPVDVPAQHCGQATGEVGPADHISPRAEGVAHGPNLRALHALVHGQHADVCRLPQYAALLHTLAEGLADAALKGEAPHGHADAPDLQSEGAGCMEDMDQRVAGQERAGDAPALVVSRHQGHMGATLGQLLEGGHGDLYQTRVRVSFVEQVSAMDDEVNFTPPGRLQGEFVIAQEVVAPAWARNPGTPRQVQTQMGVPQEQDLYQSSKPAQAAAQRGAVQEAPVAQHHPGRAASVHEPA